MLGKEIEMEKAEFITRAAAQYKQLAGITIDESIACAEVLWNDGTANADLDELNTPEDLADDDMSYWDDDGE